MHDSEDAQAPWQMFVDRLDAFLRKLIGLSSGLVGASQDTLIELFALFFLPAGILPLLRGQFSGLPGALLFLFSSLALMALIVSRVITWWRQR
ncbi:MAG: hypothetical protein ABJB47_06120 [Actinomycetota bacterium]